MLYFIINYNTIYFQEDARFKEEYKSGSRLKVWLWKWRVVMTDTELAHLRKYVSGRSSKEWVLWVKFYPPVQIHILMS